MPESDAERAVSLLGERHPGTAVIGRATGEAGAVELSSVRLKGTRAGFESY